MQFPIISLVGVVTSVAKQQIFFCIEKTHEKNMKQNRFFWNML